MTELALDTGPAAAAPVLAPRRRFMALRRLVAHRSFQIGLCLVMVLAIAAIFAPVITGIDPSAMKVRLRFKPPSETFLFGTDSFGRDVLTRVLYGARVSLWIGLVVADTVDWPLLMDQTADFVYCRLHGSEQLYVSGYDDEALDHWACLIAEWVKGRDPKEAPRVSPPSPTRTLGRDVYVYFDNDVKVRAPRDAESLASRLNAGATASRPKGFKHA